MKALLAPLAAIAVSLAAAAPTATDSPAPRGQSPDSAALRHDQPDGLLVLAVLKPERAVVADPRTGRTRERVLRGGTLCHGPLLALADRVVFFDWVRSRLVARAAQFDRLGRPRVVGSAHVATPSATPGRLWLGNRRGGRLALREVDVDGRVHARATTPGALQGTLEAHVGGEFLRSRGVGLALGRERIRDGWLLAADAERFAWCPGACRRVEVWRGRTLEPPPGIRPRLGRAAFSPDGERLALAVEIAGNTRAAVIDVERNSWHVVPRARMGTYGALAWSPSGAWLYLAAKSDRVLAARGGTARPRVLPIRTRGTVMSIATASRPGSAAR